MEHFHAVIIGAGPAGISAAYHLVRGGVSEKGVLLLEKRADHEWDKYHRMCAEGMSYASFIRMQGDPDLILNRIHRARESWPGGIELMADSEGVIVDRRRMLKRYWDRAKGKGCLSCEDEVVQIERFSDGFHLLTDSGRQYRCDYLIGADGSNSIVRRTFFPGPPPCILPVVQFVMEKGGARDELWLEYGERFRGKYRWTFPNGDGYKMGFPVGSADDPPDFSERHARAIPIGPLQHYGSRDVCIIGDAAAQANPVTFSGIVGGWEAGRMAAEALMEEDLVLYDQAWKRSPYHDTCFWQWSEALRSMNDAELERMLRPLSQGYNMNNITQAIVDDPRFSLFYRAHVRKLTWGW